MLREDDRSGIDKGGGSDVKVNKVIELLKDFNFVDSVLLFGSRVKGESGRDIDVCIVPSRELGLKERLTLESIMPSGVDISIYFELPIHIRKRIFEEGKVLYSKDMYRLLTLEKETDLEYSKYKRHREYYNKTARERMRKMRGWLNMDIERIKDKLSELQVYIVELKEDIPDEESGYLGERLRRRACERTFQLACEDVLDICNLIIAGRGFGLPKDNRDALRKIADNKIIPKKLEARLEDMVSLRNLLVHRYGKVDDSKVYYYLKEELGDLYEFAEAINKLIEY